MAEDPRKFDADAVRALLALAVTEDPPGGECPTPEEIAAWQARALTGADSERLGAHVPHCHRCLTLWTGLLETTGVLAPGRGQSDRRPGWLWSLWRHPAVVTAAVAVLALGGVLLQQGPLGRDALPAYTLQIDDRMSQRGSTPESGHGPLLFGPGDSFRLSLRPKTAVDEPVAVQAFVDSESGLAPLDAPAPRLASGGVALIDGTVGVDVQLPPGRSTLFVIVGRARDLPDLPRARKRLGGQTSVSTRAWAAWALPLDVSTAARQ